MTIEPRPKPSGPGRVGEGRAGEINLSETDMRVGRKRGRPAQSEVDRLVVSEADDPNAWDKPIRVQPRLRRGGTRRHVRVAAKKPPSPSSAPERMDRGERVVLRRGKKPEKRRYIAFSKATRGPVVKPEPGKTKISIRLDNAVLDYFRDFVGKAGGGNYHTLINDVLMEHILRRSNLALEEPKRRRKKDLTGLAGRIHLRKGFNHKRQRELGSEDPTS